MGEAIKKARCGKGDICGIYGPFWDRVVGSWFLSAPIKPSTWKLPAHPADWCPIWRWKRGPGVTFLCTPSTLTIQLLEQFIFIFYQTRDSKPYLSLSWVFNIAPATKELSIRYNEITRKACIPDSKYIILPLLCYQSNKSNHFPFPNLCKASVNIIHEKPELNL